MEKFSSDKLIERIEDAKNWLDKAKDEYSKSNPARGGLILNLAQAEVKHAWELSHDQFVSKSVQQPSRNVKLKYFIAVAASFVLFTALVIGVRLGGVLLPTAEKSKATPIAKLETGQSINPKVVALNKDQPSLVSVTPTIVGPTTLASQPNNLANSKIQEVVKQTANSSRIANSLAGDNGSVVAQNKLTIKAVSQLSIDEEALTKEASHSLRIGK
jgi:hypothetical protein